MAEMNQLTSLEQWKEALRKSSDRPLLVFKHSTSCPISAGAHEDLVQYVKDSVQPNVDFTIVHVIEDRPVSNAIAEELGVQHKSPQAILVQGGKPVWNDSHWNLTYAFFAEKLGNPKEA
ncbi:bacillithiol system redox-active protein YtxJ [Cohnella caldifontis]|uniref:bacillithiol system redox-active protein YtxJ n=1 Tax=Cohnella caldifontis TaxID=3027471 RepID=UPI0023EDC420|nr:bacillithiol system redox-active protein YtxJ [Cohnella sp. YIM B05605]